jgi:GDP-nucleotide sugar transporter
MRASVPRGGGQDEESPAHSPPISSPPPLSEEEEAEKPPPAASPTASSRASAAQIAAALALYCFVGTALTLVNKRAIVSFPLPSALLVLQNGLTVALVKALTIAVPDRVGGALPPLSASILVDWLPLVLLFVGMLATSLLALLHVSAVTLIVTRNLCTLAVAGGERVFLGTTISELSVACLFGILFGAVLYALHDISFSLIGYSWLACNIVTTSAFQIRIKGLIAQQKEKGYDSLGPFGMSYFNNLISLPVLLCVAFVSGEFETLVMRASELSAGDVGVVLLSGVLGFALSTSAFLVNRLVSATSMMVRPAYAATISSQSLLSSSLC